MKKKTTNKLEFTKSALVELNDGKMAAIAGGTSTIFIGTTSLINLTVGHPDQDITLL